ncbi:YrhB domain-containing protein [Lysobacter sp. HA35]
MITAAQARSIVSAHLAGFADASQCEMAILDSATIEKSFGWVFFYQSRQYLETGEFAHRLAGNAPLIVNRNTGDIRTTGNAFPIEHYLAQYEASLSTGGA